MKTGRRPRADEPADCLAHTFLPCCPTNRLSPTRCPIRHRCRIHRPDLTRGQVRLRRIPWARRATDGTVMTREERQRFWSAVARGEYPEASEKISVCLALCAVVVAATVGAGLGSRDSVLRKDQRDDRRAEVRGGPHMTAGASQLGAAGKFVQAWAGLADAYEWPDMSPALPSTTRIKGSCP